MTLTEMINRVRRQIPQATEETFPNSIITTELNHGVDEVNLIAEAYNSYADVPNAPSNMGIYSLSEVCPNYLNITKSGVWWFNAAGKSKYLYRITRSWLDQYIRNWRDQSPVQDPTWVSVEGDELLFYPYSNATGSASASYFRVHFLQKSTPMDNGSNYPWWNQPTEMVALRCFDNSIIAYAVWKLAPAVLDKENRNFNEMQFYKEVKKASYQVKRRPDMTSDYDYRIKTDVPNGFLPR